MNSIILLRYIVTHLFTFFLLESLQHFYPFLVLRASEYLLGSAALIIVFLVHVVLYVPLMYSLSNSFSRMSNLSRAVQLTELNVEFDLNFVRYYANVCYAFNLSH